MARAPSEPEETAPPKAPPEPRRPFNRADVRRRRIALGWSRQDLAENARYTSHFIEGVEEGILKANASEKAGILDALDRAEAAQA